jgi:hypothetical protein
VPAEPEKSAAASQIQHIRDLLEAARAEFKSRYEAYTSDLMKCELYVQQLETALADASKALQTGQTFGTLPPMPLAEPISRPHGWGRPLSDPEDALRAVGNLKEWCRRNGVGYSSLKRWRAKEGGNAIPMRWAAHFRKEYGVPFTYWPHGVTSK